MIFKLGDEVNFLDETGEKRFGVITNCDEKNRTVGISSNLMYFCRNIEDVELRYDSIKEFLNANAAEPNYHDSHYMELGVQPIDVIEQFPTEQRIGFYRGNAIKYLMRLGHKDGGLKEAEKAHRYTEWLVKALKGEKVNPRE